MRSPYEPVACIEVHAFPLVDDSHAGCYTANSFHSWEAYHWLFTFLLVFRQL
jgi:hypothetical protein